MERNEACKEKEEEYRNGESRKGKRKRKKSTYRLKGFTGKGCVSREGEEEGEKIEEEEEYIMKALERHKE